MNSNYHFKREGERFIGGKLRRIDPVARNQPYTLHYNVQCVKMYLSFFPTSSAIQGSTGRLFGGQVFRAVDV